MEVERVVLFRIFRCDLCYSLGRGFVNREMIDWVIYNQTMMGISGGFNAYRVDDKKMRLTNNIWTYRTIFNKLIAVDT